MTLRERYHVAAGELCGRIAAKLLLRLALHALAINDDLTFRRAQRVLRSGVEQGWDENDPTRHVRPNRKADYGPVTSPQPCSGENKPAGLYLQGDPGDEHPAG